MKGVLKMAELAKALSQLSLIWIAVIYFVAMALLWLLFRSMKKTRPFLGQLMVISGICLVALIFFILTFDLKVRKQDIYVTAATMPRVWIAALVPVAILTYVSILNGTSEPDKPFGRWQIVLTVAVAVFASVFLFDYIGYYLSTAIFLVLMMVTMRERSWIRLVLVPLGWCLFTFFVFDKLLFISLPHGEWITALLG